MQNLRKSHRSGWRDTIFSPKEGKLKGYYKGEWKNDRKEGQGVELKYFRMKITDIPGNYIVILRRNGLIYVGSWSNNLKHGYGVLSKVLENGDICNIYDGEWKNNKKHGFGGILNLGKFYYEGPFFKNKRQGYGRVWFCDGSYYQGTWKNDLYHGHGLFVQVNGNRYEGEFANGKKNGHGRFYHLSTGQLQEGHWKDDICINGTIEDISYRQSALFPTPYPIPKLINQS